MPSKEQVEKLKERLQEALDKLENLNVDELSDSDLDSVAGGAVAGCSDWCCSNGAPSDNAT